MKNKFPLSALVVSFLFFSSSILGQNIGISNAAPNAPLSFANSSGNKVDLYFNSATSRFGMGIQTGLLQMYSNGASSDIAFGYGSSTSFTELMRIKGNGNVGIGTTNPLFKLDIKTGSINTDSVYRINNQTVLATNNVHNLFVGTEAGRISTGTANTFVGGQAGYSNIGGSYNSFFGSGAGHNNASGNYNSFFGRYAGYSNNDGIYNSFFGIQSGNNNSGGGFNSFYGSFAGANNTNGDNNIAIGYGALTTNTTGNYITVIGRDADVLSNNLSNAIAIGSLSRVDCSNCMVLGSVNGINGATSNVNVGIGINSPSRPLSFPASLGKKISLYPGVTGDAGFGVFGNELRMHSDNSSADITFGFDDYTNGFTERMRIKANGKVGIGHNAPAYPLTFAQAVGDKIALWNDANGSYGFGIQGALLQIHSNVASADIAFGYGNSASFSEVMRIKGTGNVGIGTNAPGERLTVSGNICASGSIGACSDIRYKTNLSPIPHSLDRIIQMQGLYYYWKKDLYIDKDFSDQRQIGFSAQDVEKIFPELVQTDAQGYKSVDYSRMTPILVEAIKEQQKLIDTLMQKDQEQQQQLQELNKRLQELEKKI